MNYQILYDYDESILRQIAEIHYESLNHLSFLTLFGPKFLFHLYKVILKNKLGFFAIATEDQKIFGFALLSFDNSRLMPAIMKNPWYFFFLSIPAIIKYPGIIPKMLKTITYFNDANNYTNQVKPEFLAQVTKKGNISKGIGTKIIEEFEREYIKLGIFEYKFAIARVNNESVDFFKRRGFEVKHTYNFSGTIWNIYVKTLQPE